MSLVLDASAVAAWLMPDEAPPEGVVAALTGTGVLAAPWLLWVELRNILIMGERRGRLSPGVIEPFLNAVDDLGIELDTATPSARVVQLARRNGLTAYDALYLELALRRGFALLTLDTALRQAAEAEGAALFR